jgi:uncharacterized protein (DUF1778 family)
MQVQLNKEERIEIRVSAKDKDRFKKAQELSGDKTFSSFLVRVLRQHSDKIISEKEKFLKSERDKEIFFNAVLEDAQPNYYLREAAERYNTKIDKD